MTPTMCRTKHNPPSSYGDCLRACIASIMDADPDQVPHFADLGATGPEALASVRRWLRPQGYTVTGFAFPAGPVADVLQFMGENNPDTLWLLFGSTAASPDAADGGDHVNVCRGGAVVHDPAWIPSSIKTVGASGYWEIWVVSRT